MDLRNMVNAYGEYLTAQERRMQVIQAGTETATSSDRKSWSNADIDRVLRERGVIQ
jgi:hypothetical protein